MKVIINSPLKLWLLCSVPVLVLAMYLILNRIYIDGFFGNALAIFVGEKTEYAVGYSDRGFKDIRVGARKEEVLKRLGPPLHVYNSEGREFLFYSRPLSQKDNFLQRIIVTQDNVVIGKTVGFSWAGKPQVILKRP